MKCTKIYIFSCVVTCKALYIHPLDTCIVFVAGWSKLHIHTHFFWSCLLQVVSADTIDRHINWHSLSRHVGWVSVDTRSIHRLSVGRISTEYRLSIGRVSVDMSADTHDMVVVSSTLGRYLIDTLPIVYRYLTDTLLMPYQYLTDS